jgi:hypothetical protein
MARRAKGVKYASTKASAVRNDNTRALTQGKSGVRRLSSQDATAVGRPGFGPMLPGPVDGKIGVKRLMVRDPAKGISSSAADKITTAKTDLIGTQNPTILSQQGVPQPIGNARKVVPPSRPLIGSSKLPRSNTPGKVTRPRKR